MKNATALLITALIFNSLLTACSNSRVSGAGFYVPEYSKEEKRKVHSEITTKGGKPREDLKHTITWLRDCQVLREQVQVGGAL